MNKSKRNRIIALLIVGFIGLVVLVFMVIFNNLPIYKEHGRRFVFVFPEIITIQAPPPRMKLLAYMNMKYGTVFKEYKGEEYKETGFRWSHEHSEDFDKYYNGITVYTDDYPGHYFFVCDQYGTIHDDYGCHFAQAEAEQIIYDRLQDKISEDFKVTVHPNCFQENVFKSIPTGSEYLDNGDYIIRIFICSEGSRAESDEQMFETELYPYWREHKYLDVYYVDSGVFDSIDPCNFTTYCGDIDCNKHTQGWGLDENGERQNYWGWICD
ncbi:MAG: hypothetical protein J6I96_02095 [Oscillospiraceae bacterium]|nr:hypothetical protein [Oscillospiraceae bacterium]